MPCPLCNGNTAFFFEDERRAYQQCKKCALIFVPAEFHLMRAEEKAQYDLHENNPKTIFETKKRFFDAVNNQK